MHSALTAAPLAPPAPHQGSDLREGHWDILTRSGVRLQVTWQPHDAGRQVWLQLKQVSGPGETREYTAYFGFASGMPREGQWMFGSPRQPVEVTLSLHARSAYGEATLWANVPLKTDEFYNGPIGHWAMGPPAPGPQPEPGPLPPEPDEVFIENLPGATDLCPFLWLHPPTTREQADSLLRYVVVPDPQSLELFNTLAAITGPDAASGKRQAAQNFRANPQYVADVSSLTPPIDQFPAMRMELLAVEGHQTPAQLREQADALLGQAVPAFLALATTTTALDNTWQSVFVLALTGTTDEARQAAGLVDVLRVMHYLQLLNDDQTPLQAAPARQLALRATPALPDAVAACGLSGSVPASPASAPTVSGHWQLLGVGQLELARQHLLGYTLGALAEVVNLMPRERQERHHLSKQSQERQRLQSDELARSDSQTRQSDAASELADTLKEALFSEGMVRNLNGVMPSYDNLNLLLTGTASEGAGKLNWDGSSVARLMQHMSEQAARKVADKLSAQRTEVWREWREHRELQCIDNHEGSRLVGVYRWVDQLLRVQLLPQGRRLILAFQIQAPAQPWVAQLAAQGPVPLVAPAPLDLFDEPKGQGYQRITPANYQSLGAQYGLIDLTAPPPEQLSVSAQINRVTVADASLIVVPQGYQVVGGSATVALADNTCSLTASIGGTPLTVPTPTAVQSVSLTVPAATSSTSVGTLTVTPAQPAAASLDTTTFKAGDAVLGLTGAVTVTVMSNAPLFGLSVTLICQRSTLPDTSVAGEATTVDPLLVAWQMRIYERLLRAWQTQARTYDTELAARITAASEGHTDAVQRDVLRSECLSLLTQTGATTEAPALVAWLDWAGMSWHYDTAALGTSSIPSANPAAPVATEPASARLFKRFVAATSAWVLLPVRPDTQQALLFALQFQPHWPQASASDTGLTGATPVTQSTVLPLEEQRHLEAEPAERPGWTLRLPLPIMYLQDGDALPHLGPHTHRSAP